MGKLLKRIARTDRLFLAVAGACSVLLVILIISLVHAGVQEVRQRESATGQHIATEAPVSPAPTRSVPPIVDYPSDMDNPLHTFDRDWPDTQRGTVRADYRNGSIVTTNDVKLSSADISDRFRAASSPCSLTSTGGICLAGETPSGKDYTSYFLLKDAARNTLLSDARDIRQVEVSGSPASVTATVSIDGRSSRVVLISAPDTSVGFLVVLGDVSTDVELGTVDALSVSTGADASSSASATP